MGLDQDNLLKEDLIKSTDDFQERRAQAITAKALEIEKVWRTPDNPIHILSIVSQRLWCGQCSSLSTTAVSGCSV